LADSLGRRAGAVAKGSAQVVSALDRCPCRRNR